MADVAGNLRGVGHVGVAPSSSQFFHHDIYDFNARARPGRLNGYHGRGTSLERTEKERRVQILPNGEYVSNVGDTALASPPAPDPDRSPAPADLIAKNPPTEGVRATYRAWRYPLTNVPAEKAWSINEPGDDDDQGGRVEKLISDAMAGVEPNNRSRKASHSLGFFKEGLPEDKSKKREARGRGRPKEVPSPVKPSRGQDMGKKLPDSYTRDPVQRAQVTDIPSENGRRPSVEGGRPASVPASTPSVLDFALASGPSTKTGYFDLAIDTEVPREARALPAQLLAEIRKHHNLTPGATKGTSFSRSLPVTESERPKDEDNGSEVKSVKSSERNEEDNSDGAELSPVKSADDEDESGEEQISSALFLPHQSSRDSPEGDDNVFESVPDRRADDRRSTDVSNLQRWLEQYEVPSRDLSQKDSRSRPVPIPSPARVKPPSSYAGRGSVASESGDVSGAEQEIPDDSGYTTAGEELVDDPDLTPVGSVKPDGYVSSWSTRTAIDEVPDPKRPLEAIELIPYRHQVGGHTTMWRFSKRAVCKQLTNRENEFYEKVERYHPQLLKFLPRFV